MPAVGGESTGGLMLNLMFLNGLDKKSSFRSVHHRWRLSHGRFLLRQP
ncbi:hypothetical protein OK016_24420 [Vibrio chagasii]|nr:hypothetical protein [Vibrio chagasii]